MPTAFGAFVGKPPPEAGVETTRAGAGLEGPPPEAKTVNAVTSNDSKELPA